MRTAYLDSDTLALAYEAFDCIKIAKALEDRGIPYVLPETRIIADEDIMASFKWYFIEENCDTMFGTTDVSNYILNSEDLKDSNSEYDKLIWEEFGEEMSDWYSADEISICGIFIKPPSLMKLLDYIDENNLDIDKMGVYEQLYVNLNNYNYASWEHYFEFFLAKRARDFGICLCYTEPTYFSVDIIESYYDFLEYIDIILASEIKDEWRKVDA